MKEFRIDNKGTGKLFENKILESLTRTRFFVPVSFFYVAGLCCLILAYWLPQTSLMKFFWLFPLGMLGFTLVEYIMHRFLFHLDTSTEARAKFQYSVHGVHHEFPRDKDRLVMPIVLSIPLSALFGLLFVALMGLNGIIFFGGFVSGYSTYLYIHYAIHAMKPPKNFLKYLWKHHSMHHYASEGTAYGVSIPLWDFVFGTMPTEKNISKAPVDETASAA
jgi:sterol desaturase/sphingolipid hydroxylase (fatty acid hydroxylase superfamily)